VRATFAPVPSDAVGVFPQVGYAIGKHCGNAVVRNSLRRRMRESARAIATTLPRGSYLLRVEPAAATAPAHVFAADVQRALQRAAAADRVRP
jgi:ribonuclease P protein component